MVREFDLRSAALYARVRRSGRVLVVVDTLLSSISWTLLMYASTHAFEQLPKWAGPLDGVIAFIVVILFGLTSIDLQLEDDMEAILPNTRTDGRTTTGRRSPTKGRQALPS
jgi:hypothetical protein